MREEILWSRVRIPPPSILVGLSKSTVISKVTIDPDSAGLNSLMGKAGGLGPNFKVEVPSSSPGETLFYSVGMEFF